MRGGKREGAGRKRALSFSESILLGQLCEDLQCDIPIKHAMQEYKKHPDVRALQDARDRLTGKTSKERARIIRGEISTQDQGCGAHSSACAAGKNETSDY